MSSKAIIIVFFLTAVGFGFFGWPGSRAGAQISNLPGGQNQRFAIIVHPQEPGEAYLLDTATGEVWRKSHLGWVAIEKYDVRDEGKQERIDRGREGLDGMQNRR